MVFSKRRLPPLNALPAFEAVARLGSVTAAAEELGRTHGAVSKQLRKLTEDLGVALVEKDGVGLRLTERGERLLAMLEPTLDRLDETCRALRAEATDASIEIALSATLAMRWLMPRMPRFYERFPGAEVNLRMVGGHWLSESEVDAFLSWDRLREPPEGDNLRILGDSSYGLVAAHGYALDIAEDCVRFGTALAQQDAPQVWTGWERLSGVRVEAETSIAYPHRFLALEAAAAGMGAAIAERRLVESDLETGRLIAPYGFFTVAEGFTANISPRGVRRAVVSRFLDWIGEEARRPAPIHIPQRRGSRR